MKKLYFFAFLASAICIQAQTIKPIQIESWVTNADRSALFSKQDKEIQFGGDRNRGWSPSVIVVDEQLQMQSVDGFGFALTGGSAELLIKMSANARANILRELFATDGKSIGISYLRISIGASDLNSFVYSYNDLPDGKTDLKLEKFNLSQDLNDVIPVMKEILAINPSIQILASPWSAPAWMKTSNNPKSGNLKKEYFDVYALYFVKYIQAMKAQGISIDAITIQNEPLNSNNTPSMQMLASDQKEFIKSHLGPTFEKNGIKTKIVLFDHNLDRIDYPLSILNDPEAAKYVDGSGFHHYGGDLTSMSVMHTAFPDKNLYFTEQMVVEKPGSSSIEIASQVKRLILGASLNWSRNVILWNIGADPLNDPHTDNGGCSMCQGAITIDKDSISRNLAYYTIAHASKFVRPGSVRIGSTQKGDKVIKFSEDEERQGQSAVRIGITETYDVLPNVAFRTPDGKTVLIVVNDSYSVNSFKIQFRGQFANVRLSPGGVGTYVW